MAKKEYPTVTYFNNYYGESGYTYADYKDYCIENDVDEDEIGEDGSNQFHEWVNDMLEIDWDDFTSSIKYDANFDVVVLGSCGTWRGNIDIIPKKFNSLLSAIYACIKNCSYYKIKLENGYIEVKSSHHDGTNNFTIKKLSERGRKLNWKYEDIEFKPYMGKKIEGYLF